MYAELAMLHGILHQFNSCYGKFVFVLFFMKVV
jgi:hypothetical protein